MSHSPSSASGGVHRAARPAPMPQIDRYQQWLAAQRGLRFDDYDALWRWSVTDLEAFWGSVFEYFDIESPTPHQRVLAEERMPGARWFPGARVNYARQALRHVASAHAAGRPAIVFRSESGAATEMSWPELARQVEALARALKSMGVVPGDRVCAYLPNIPQTIVAFLATASVGAIWSVCSPDMGPVSVLDRFRQIAPRVLIACDGYRYGGKAFDRRPVLGELLAELPSVRTLLLLGYLDAGCDPAEFTAEERQAIRLETILADGADAAPTTGDGTATGAQAATAARGFGAWAPDWVDFDHPLWVVYSSGTTGMPKPIVHGHGGVLLEGLKLGVLHNDIGPEDRFHWYSSTGWIMWNCQVSALLAGATACIYDGNPGWPDWSTLWRFVGETGVSFFGAGAAFYASCLKAGVKPESVADLSRLRALGSTGSPLAPECYEWGYQELGRDVWWCVISGGTDFAGAFIGGNRKLPVISGEMQCRCLGAAVEAWSEDGKPLVDEVGELVCTRPMPSMPLYLWGDDDGSRYRDSYFDVFPGVWRHGDWIRITPRGGAIIYGRSDATINRFGIRMGTAELYRAVEGVPEVLDSLVVDLEYLGRESYMPLFVVLREGVVLDAALRARLVERIRKALSARHVPSEILQVPEVPRTLSGKKMELPVKKLLLGQPLEKSLNRDAMANPSSVDWFVAFARERAAAG